ncbi:MAG: Heavy metal translocating P-type ATPase, partial [Adhaeribacter sp.]|nr:Heavy metal translocating P-type ATPase [Adhaeribacter sp.]
MRGVAQTLVPEKEYCYHCGDTCAATPIYTEEKAFCCTGCKAVYELLYANNLCTYYSLEADAPAKPGVAVKEAEVTIGQFTYLDEAPVLNQLLNFQSADLHKVLFRVPAMHCSSCIWLLENLQKLDNGIIESRVNFPRKEVTIAYNPQQTKLSNVVTLLHKIGYSPTLNLDNLSEKKQTQNKSIYLKLGLAAFSFSNIMLFSFPEYFAFTDEIKLEFGSFFGYLSIVLALPVLLYSARGFFESAWASLRQRHINLD